MKIRKFKIVIFITILTFMLSGCGGNHSEQNMSKQQEENIDRQSVKKENSEDKIEESSELNENFKIEENIFKQLDIQSYFANYKTACCIIRFEDSEKGISWNEEIAEERISPLSTFKIMSSIILLEEKIITDVNNQIIVWDGTIYDNATWNSDQTLASAFENSVVWVYEELLSKVDKKVIADYLEKVDYGNKDISGGSTFWLDSSLQISLKEQIVFLEGLYYNHFSFDENTIKIIKELMYESSEEKYVLYGKTGTSSEGENLYVGFIEKDKSPYFFATYVYEEMAGYNIAKDITIKMAELLFK